MSERPPGRVVISNGSYKFHLAPLAVEMERRGRLAAFLAAGWPIGWQKKFAESRRGVGWKRFLDRGEPISERFVWSSPLTEFCLKVGDALRARSQRLQQQIHRVGFRVFARMASRALRKTRPVLYHYRCCYGGKSVEVARRLGIPVLCDHSVAHPRVADYLVDHEGVFPPQDGRDHIVWPLSRQADEDLARADHVLVNSDFVKETCVHAGMDPARVHVVYLGVDDKFLATCPASDEGQIPGRPPRLLFAGGWQVRKGVRTLMTALDGLDVPWELDVIAGLDPEFRSDPQYLAFAARSNVRVVGTVPRAELAAHMARHTIFVFPSYCEGSARVIFEAMACGCAIVTTPNSGSVVEDGVHGRIVPPGDVAALREAVAWMLRNPAAVAEMGRRNARLVVSRYRQSDYADAVEKIYDRLRR